ncbi:MAG TPA: roadblock/LC7 domain-containing protein [Chloroflexota bacterium]|jgi:predicted regulator of Ras-like GTPase activity (Roadblock/LC7/MglB family)
MAASPRLTNIVLLPEQVDLARTQLASLVEESGADGALLLLRSGEIAVAHLETTLAQVDALGALIAANFASAREIARLLGESRFESQFQQGAGRQLITHAVGEGWILAVIFAQATALGMVRMLASRAAEALRPLYHQAHTRAGEASQAPTDPRFRAAAARAVDQLFGEHA